jgi:hypothetical protein
MKYLYKSIQKVQLSNRLLILVEKQKPQRAEGGDLTPISCSLSSTNMSSVTQKAKLDT